MKNSIWDMFKFVLKRKFESGLPPGAQECTADLSFQFFFITIQIMKILEKKN